MDLPILGGRVNGRNIVIETRPVVKGDRVVFGYWPNGYNGSLVCAIGTVERVYTHAMRVNGVNIGWARGSLAVEQLHIATDDGLRRAREFWRVVYTEYQPSPTDAKL